MGEKYQIKIREYEHKTTQMCTEKYLDYPIRTRIWVMQGLQKNLILSIFWGCKCLLILIWYYSKATHYYRETWKCPLENGKFFRGLFLCLYSFLHFLCGSCLPQSSAFCGKFSFHFCRNSIISIQNKIISFCYHI